MSDLEKYTNSNNKYMFHGSSIPIKQLEVRTSHDSSKTKSNIDTAIFLTPSIKIASAYAFKDGIKKRSQGLEWNFNVSQYDEDIVMEMSNVIIPNKLIGYIHVFENRDDFVNDPLGSLQYKSYKSLKPIDIIAIKYEEFEENFVVLNKKKAK